MDLAWSGWWSGPVWSGDGVWAGLVVMFYDLVLIWSVGGSGLVWSGLVLACFR